MKKTLASLALAALALYAFGCGGGETAVASVQVVPAAVQLPLGELRTVRLTWTPVAPLDGATGEPIVFVHLLDDKDTVARTFDHPFPQKWREGAPASYDLKLYQSALAPPLSAGKYRLTAGLYDKEGKRWALDGVGEPLRRNEYKIADVEVPAQGAGPKFGFSPAWLPVEPGGDRQVMARRWLLKPGAIRVLNLRSPGTVWMVLRIPEPSPEEKLVLEKGANAPAVLVNGNCGGVDASISGAGIHEIELPMEPPPPSVKFCRVILTPNFHLEPRGVGQKRSVSLENLGWAPAAGRGGRVRPPAPSVAPEAPAAP